MHQNNYNIEEQNNKEKVRVMLFALKHIIISMHSTTFTFNQKNFHVLLFIDIIFDQKTKRKVEKKFLGEIV